MATRDERVRELRDRIIANAPDPAEHADEFMRDALRNAQIAHGVVESTPRPPEVSVRLHGDGVPHHDVPVLVAAELLEGVQLAVTSVGRALRRTRTAPLPRTTDGKRIAVSDATELRLSSEINAGSVVFFLSGRPERVTGDEMLGLTASETFLDSTLRELLGVISDAAEDSPEATSELSERIRRLGADAAASFDRLAKRSLDSDVEVDLGWRNPIGRRATAGLSRRGAHALRDAVERNREQDSEDTFVGTLRTVSDGSDRLRIDRADTGKPVRLAVEPALGLTLGRLLGHIVRVNAEVHTVWHLTTGKETKTYRFLDAEDHGPAAG